MMSETPTADTIFGAVATGEMLWPHNAEAVNDVGVEMAVLASLSRPTEAPNGRALHRRAGTTPTPCRPLLAALNRSTNWTLFDLDRAPCDRCVEDVAPRHTLLVSAGATAVELHVCTRCHTELSADMPDLVWS